ncbi:MAG: discoidin domain-containing protein [Lachnospiraceae bacterium]|nr:discoidin domain-containing protein [Lachnospiraceae bacterium]
MKVGKCIAGGVLTAAMICQSLYVPGGFGIETVKAAAANVALNKPATASGVESGVENCTPDKAVDGDATESSRWAAPEMRNSIMDNETHTPQWLMLDLKAAGTEVETIKITYHLKVWSTQYKIQTSETGTDGTWEDVYTQPLRDSGDNNAVVDTISVASMANTSLKRYVRFYFERVNNNAGGLSVSVREIEILGTQTGVIHTVSNAQEAINSAVPVEVSETDTAFGISEVPGYDVEVYGSEADRLIGDDGTLSPLRIGDRTINVIVKAANKTNANDTAKKNVSVTVRDNTSQYPALFPEVANPNPEPKVLPSLQEWYGYEGDFTISKNTEIVYHDAANLGLAEVAREMQADLTEICGFVPNVKEGTAHDSDDIYLESLTSDTYGTGDEGYLMVTDENGIHISSAGRTGVLYGTVTVEQILYQDREHQAVPKGVIRDYPLYAVRGIMMDVARIPTRMQFLEDYTKIVKWYKLNEMQIHLNDNQWSEPAYSPNYEKWAQVEASHRLYSDTFPSLATQESKYMKSGDNEGRYDYYYNVHTGTKEKTGEAGELYYTKKEFKEFQNQAEARGIRVVAELDTPGHSAAYTKYVYENQEEVIKALVDKNYLNRADYLDSEGNIKEGVSFYIHNPNNFELLAIDESSTDTETRQNAVHAKIFMTALFDEYLEGDDPVFTSDTVSAGVDEYWDKNTGNNKEAFRNYMNDMYDLLGDKYGKEVRMWGALEAIPGTTEPNKNIILEIWNGRGEDNVHNRIREGYRVINVPQMFLYVTPGRYHKDIIREEYIYNNWDPTLFDGGNGGARVDKGEPSVLGAKAALWGDANRSGTTEADLNERYLRSCAMVSEKTWGGQKADDTFLEYEQTFDRLREGPGTKIANQIDSKTNVVLDYNFENVSKDGATIYDASGNGYSGTITNGTVVQQAGEAMLKFDGNTKIETPLTSLGYPYTMSFDVYLDGSESNTKESSLFSGYDGRLQAAGMNGSLSLNRDYFTQSFDYQIEQRVKHRITIVGTYQVTKLYVDGRFVKILYAAARDIDNGGSLGNQNWTDSDNNYTSTFVFPLNTIGQGFSGYLGNIKAYNKSLSTEELAAEGFTGTGEADVARNRHAYTESGNTAYLKSGENLAGSDSMKLYPAWKATDGDGHVTGAAGVSTSSESRWNSSNNDTDYLMVDLGEVRTVNKVVIDWEANRYAASYKIQVSADGKNWEDAKSVTGNTNALTTDTFTAKKARYVKMQGVQRKSGAAEYAVYEMKVYGSVDKGALKAACDTKASELKQKDVSWENANVQFEGYVLAKAVLGDVLAGQEEVERALEILQAAGKKDEALKDPEIKTLLEQESLYEIVSWNVFKEAYDAVKNAPIDIPMEQLQVLIDAMKTAQKGLVKKPNEPDKPGKPDKPAPVPGPGPQVTVTRLAAPAVTAVKSTAEGVKVSWGAAANAFSYQLYRKTGSKVTKVGGAVKGTSAIDTAPLGGKNMSYYVVAISGNPKAYTDSAAGSAKSIMLPKATGKVTAKQAKGKKAVSIKWTKVKRASSYMIYRSEGKKGKWKRIATVKKKNSYTDKKVKKKKSYSYKVIVASAKKYSPAKAAKKVVKVK